MPKLSAVEDIVVGYCHCIQLRIGDIPLESIKAKGEWPVADRRDCVDVQVNLLQGALRLIFLY